MTSPGAASGRRRLGPLALLLSPAPPPQDAMTTSNDIKVFITGRDTRCDACKEDLGRHAWMTLDGERALCLSCADLDHLVFLPSGDAALTRRARKQSRLSAVVLKWSRARQRYERQGLLVEDDALTQAEEACEADAATRAVRNSTRRTLPASPPACASCARSAPMAGRL